MRIIDQGLTFDDVLLVPAHSAILPNEVCLKTQLTQDIQLNIPIMSAAMDTVTESRLAIAMAQEGGIGIIHKNLTIEQQAEEVKRVKKYESGVVNNPITVAPQTPVGELMGIVHKYGISGLPVVDTHGVLVGIVTHRDWRFETDANKTVASIMTPKEKLITAPEGTSQDEIIAKLREHRLEKILLVNHAFELKGMVTVKDLQKAKDKPLASKDHSGRLRVGAAVGTSADTDDRLEALVAAGVDVVTIDTAHGHSQSVLEKVKSIRQRFPNTQLIGGNVATGDGALALASAGVNAVKVGIGPGSICTTRVIAGVGVPQITAIHQAYKALQKQNIPIIADGGIRYSGDIAKAIAAGASMIMIGSLLAGTEEAPGETILYKGRTYKTYRGMGSLGAMSQAQGSRDRYFQANQNNDKLVPEGIEGRVPFKGPMLNVLHQLLGGVRASMGYTGVSNINALATETQFVQISSAGVRESHVHDVTITKEAPNYRER